MRGKRCASWEACQHTLLNEGKQRSAISGSVRFTNVRYLVSTHYGVTYTNSAVFNQVIRRQKSILKDQLNLPGPDFIDRVWSISDRSPAVLRSLQSLFDNGRLAGTGYVSILPVDQGIEHSAGALFAPNPQYFDPENIVKLAIEGRLQRSDESTRQITEISRALPGGELLHGPLRFDQLRRQAFQHPIKRVKFLGQLLLALPYIDLTNSPGRSLNQRARWCDT